jgi:predicted metalloprotease with PDZ domain
MKRIFLATVTVGVLICARAPASPGPALAPAAAPIVTPKDVAYPGEIHLDVDASDVERRIVHVHEAISGVKGDTVLLYPEWLPGQHGPDGPIDRFADLKITANGSSVMWTRDRVNMYAFHLQVPAGANVIEVEFEYLSPTSPKVGAAEFSSDILMLEWIRLVLYPAGYFTRQIPIRVDLMLPKGWQFGSALDIESSNADRLSFKRTTVETLVDSPLFAGRNATRIDLDPNGAVPVHLDLFADRPELLAVKPEQIEMHRALIKQAYRIFGSHHYAHYDFLYSLSDHVKMIGLEHHQSSEDGMLPTVFTEWDKQPWLRDLLPHEYAHSWNGKFRRPADLWTPNYNVPMRNSLLWVYEGQTQFWGHVLAARSGLWTKQQALDQLAVAAANLDARPGRQWRSLQDTTNDEIIDSAGHFIAWRSWQRFADYYAEGELIWLDVDTLIRERSHGKRSLDDFARSFFGINDGSIITVTYTFEDIVKALNAVESYDWAPFLRDRLDAVGKPAPLAGIRRGGYKLVYDETPSDYSREEDTERKRLSLLFSIGLVIDEKDASVLEVLWDSPAFKAKLTEGTQLLAINGVPYSADVLKAAIQSAKNSNSPIELIVKMQDRYRVVNLDYKEGPRFPHLVRDPLVPALLDDLFSPR